MSDAIENAVFVVAVSSVITALGTLWLCWRAIKVSKALVDSDRIAKEERALMQRVVMDALARIEAAAAALKAATSRLAESVEIGNDTGYRIEHAAEDVAQDLADSISRADAMPNDGNYGAAADAALRSPRDD